MGIFASCSNALLRFLALGPAKEYYYTQQPLPLGDIALHHKTGTNVYPETVSTGFQCQYPAMEGWESCNGPESRDCWLKDAESDQPIFSQYDINTNYEDSWPQGIQREFWLNVTDQTISPDGYLKPEGKVFNNSYPGPLIEACWGDDITIHVTNYVKTNGSTVHWHGIRQLHTNEADGVNGVTQCPIATGESYTYNFKAIQYGHSWYHSHYSLQYPDGVAAPLLIHGPSSANWDYAWDPILISDWSHNSAFADFEAELNGTPGGPVMQTVVLNGTVAWEVDTQAVNDVLNNTFEADIDTVSTHGAFRWDLTDIPLWLNFSSPTILNLANTTFNTEYAIVEENYNRGYVYLVITSQLLFKNETKRFIPAAHPIHLHGHDFVILAQSLDPYNVTTSPKTFNFNNPPRRDVALLPGGGYLAIAFKPDNPGVWLVHCHIAWHASSGLALQILERQEDIEGTIGSLNATRETCKGWDGWLEGHVVDQDDSGI
ncbi:hypothetical protein P7C71_g309, partial [Lecanoromycetidae sp. Uapishka_2]